MKQQSSGLDPFFFHLPEYRAAAVAPAPAPTHGFESFDGLESFSGTSPIADDEEARFPVLVRVPYADYAFVALSPGAFRETARIGNVVSGDATKSALSQLGQLPGVVVEMSREAGSLELQTSLSTIRGTDVATVAGTGRGSDCIVALLDGGIDVLHEAFLDQDGKSRILCVWSQEAAGATPKALGYGDFDYGRLYTAQDIATALEKQQAPPGLPRTQPIYGNNDPTVHGTHVASIAAGSRRTDAPDDFQGGVAPDARIVVVIPKLHTAPGDPNSVGYSKGHVDALAFVSLVAERHKLPVVVNISIGMAAGAHDGSSTLEAAFDAFTGGGRAPGRIIVKSAGNSRGMQKHAVVKVGQGGGSTIKLAPPPNEAGDRCTIEAWFSSADLVDLELRNSSGVVVAKCSIDAPAMTAPTGGGDAAMTYTRFHHDNGDSQILVTLPTAGGGPEVALRFFGRSIRSSGNVDLWIEGPLAVKDVADRGRTLTVPGTAHTVVTVAASSSDGLDVPAFSSQGPTRDGRFKPEIFAPGADIRAAHAGTARGAITKSGTSMAAPHVTGAIALLFSQQVASKGRLPNAAQVRAALIATAQNLNPQWNQERGFGLLDVKALLEAFAES